MIPPYMTQENAAHLEHLLNEATGDANRAKGDTPGEKGGSGGGFMRRVIMGSPHGRGLRTLSLLLVLFGCAVLSLHLLASYISLGDPELPCDAASSGVPTVNNGAAAAGGKELKAGLYPENMNRNMDPSALLDEAGKTGEDKSLLESSLASEPTLQVPMQLPQGAAARIGRAGQGRNILLNVTAGRYLTPQLRYAIRADEERSPVFSSRGAGEGAGGKVAVCLVGGAREFELTGPSIMRRLLLAYPGTHLFINSPLDENSYKLHSLAWASPDITIAAVRVFPSRWVDETAYPDGILNDINSPQGNQGMFQYFRLVEGCIPLIRSYEATHGFRFPWIIRSRVDGYWKQPPPALSEFSDAVYTIPYGTDCLGFNDRLGVGSWRTSLPGIARLAMLPLIEPLVKSLTQINSELAFKAQFNASGTPVVRHHFHFCVVSRRSYPNDMMPITSLGSGAALNGAKCRPCTPLLKGRRAEKRLRRYAVAAQIGPVVSGVDLCNARTGWEEGWERVFDRDVGPTLARDRRRIMSASASQCSAHFDRLRTRTALWDAPEPHVLCERKSSGPVVTVGAWNSSFGTLLSPILSKQPGQEGHHKKVITVFKFAGAESAFSTASWEAALKEKGKEEGLTAEIVRHSVGSKDQLPSVAQSADILLLSLGQKGLSAILKQWVSSGGAPPACQLLIAYETKGSRSGSGGESGSGSGVGAGWGEANRILATLYFHLNSCIQEPEQAFDRCTYFSTIHCS